MTRVELLAQIARRDPARSEATLQADIRQLVLTAPLSLSAENVVTADLETPVGIRRRIDIEVSSCLIEVKRDLSSGNVLSDAIEQLADYLAARQDETGCRYVGILTDGSDWRCVCLPGAAEAGPTREVSAYQLSPARPDLEPFLIWLEGVLATARDIPATPREIRQRLGAGSSAYEKGAITADHLAAQCIHMIDPEDPGLVLSDVPDPILDRMLTYAQRYQPDRMVSTYGILPAADQVEAARSWIADLQTIRDPKRGHH